MNATGTLNIPFTNLEIFFFWLTMQDLYNTTTGWLSFREKKKKGMGNRFSQVKTAMLEISKWMWASYNWVRRSDSFTRQSPPYWLSKTSTLKCIHKRIHCRVQTSQNHCPSVQRRTVHSVRNVKCQDVQN